MEPDLSQVIVTTIPNATTTCVHHRDFPEIRSEASSAQEAATLLINNLTRALDTALTDWRRGRIDRAIADVKAFVDHKS
jgi:hypothetical protein